VIVVGGGLTGCAAAYVFAAAGVKCVLLEADRVGSGSTARSSGLLRPDPGASFRETVGRYGLRDARALWQNTRRASLEMAAVMRRLSIRCDPSALDALTFARAAREAERPLRREYEAQREAGLEVAWLNARALASEAAIDLGVGGVKVRDGAQLDPYRAALGLAAAARARGALVFERTPVSRIRAGRKKIDVKTARGSIAGQAVVIATGYPPSDLKGLKRHFSRELAYAVVTAPMPAAMRRAVGRRRTTLQDVDAPSHTLRWLRDDTVLFAGASQPEVPLRSRPKLLEQKTWQLMYELSLIYPALSGIQPTHAWDIPVARTVDGLPYLGTHRNYPRHLFALGIDPHRIGHSWLAARLLLRQFRAEAEKSDGVWGFGRIL
jgi:glycine/D-amino acid oxidase-like deaminating enzyme